MVGRGRRGASPSAAPSPREKGVRFGDFEEARWGASDVGVVPERERVGGKESGKRRKEEEGEEKKEEGK